MAPLQLALLAVLALNAESTNVVLEFSSLRCGPCQQISPTVHKLMREGLPLVQIDGDARPDLVQKYGIKLIPCFVVIVDGRVVDRVQGALSESQMRALVARVPPPARAAAPQETKIASNGMRDTRELRAPVPGRIVRGEAEDKEPDFSREMLDSTSRIRVKTGMSSNVGTGTCVGLANGRYYFLTCGHIFNESGESTAVEIDLFSPEGVKTFPAKLVRYDAEADLGLVSVQTPENLPVRKIVADGVELTKGQAVTTVGCNGGEPPTVMHGNVTSVNRYFGPETVECSGVPAQGRSGGAVFTKSGLVAAVCSAANKPENCGIYIGPEAIHKFLDESRAAFLYRTDVAIETMPETPAGPAAPSAPVDNYADILDSADKLLAEGTLDTVNQTPGDIPPSKPAAPSIETGGLDGLDEESEVVLVIRPIKGRQPSRVMVINRASREFVGYLSRELEAQQAIQKTTITVPEAPLLDRAAPRVDRRASSKWSYSVAEHTLIKGKR